MNILFVHDHKLQKYKDKYYSVGGLGGELFAQKYMFDNEDKLYIYTRYIKSENIQNKKLHSIDSVNVNPSPSEYYKEVKDILLKNKQIKNEIKERLKNIDICIIRLPSVLGNFVYKEAKKLKIPIFLEVVACAWASIFNYGGIKGKLFAPYMYFKTKKYIKNAQFVQYVSNEFLQNRYPTKGKSIGCSDVIVTDFNEQIFLKKIKNIDLKEKNSKYVLGLVGSLNINYKGHETVIKAVARIKNKLDVEVQFLGAGDKSKWENLIKKYGVEENIKFIGVLPSGKPVLDWLDKLDLHLIISKIEGLPRILVESMSRANISIGSNIGGIPELLESDMLIKPNEDEKLAELIIDLLKNKVKMKKIAERNFEFSKNYEYIKLSEKRRKFYSDAIKEMSKIAKEKN